MKDFGEKLGIDEIRMSCIGIQNYIVNFRLISPSLRSEVNMQ